MAYAQKTLDQLRFGLNSLTFKASRIYQMLKPLVVKVEDALAPKVEVSLYDGPKSTYEDLNHVSLQLQPGDLALLHTLSAHEITTLLHSGHMAELPFKGYFSNRQKGIDFYGIHYHQRQVFMAYDMAGELELANLVYPAALTEIPGPVMKAHSELLKNCLHPSSTGIILKSWTSRACDRKSGTTTTGWRALRPSRRRFSGIINTGYRPLSPPVLPVSVTTAIPLIRTPG